MVRSRSVPTVSLSNKNELPVIEVHVNCTLGEQFSEGICADVPCTFMLRFDIDNHLQMATAASTGTVFTFLDFLFALPR